MSQEPAQTPITGYHGCDSANVPDIKAENFRCSRGKDHWLGEGVYFFCAEFSNPSEDAKQWAIAQSWDNVRQTRFYHDYSVLKASIIARKPLDMTQNDGKAKVNLAREASLR